MNQQGDMNVLQPQGHQEGTQTRWATWKEVGRVMGLPWSPLLSCVVLAGQIQLEARGPLRGACKMTHRGLRAGLETDMWNISREESISSP